MSKEKCLYLSVNKTSSVRLRSELIENFFLHKQIVGYRVGAGAAILASWSRSRVKMKRLYNNGGGGATRIKS